MARKQLVQSSIEPRLLTLEQVAENLGVSVQVVQSLARSGSLTAIRIGREWRVDRLLLDDAALRKAVRAAPFRADPEARLERITQLYEQGLTQTEVGREVGLTGARVGVILRKAGIRRRSSAASALLSAQRRDLAFRRRDEIREAYARSGDAAVVARELQVPMAAVKEIVSGLPRARVYRRRAPYVPRYTDDELLNALRMAAEHRGEPLRGSDYDSFRKDRGHSGQALPARITFDKRFGSWNQALASAGLQTSRSSGRAGKYLFSSEDCLDALRKVSAEIGAVPSVTRYTAAARSFQPALPTEGCIRQRFGRWKTALTQAGLL
jgi:excisionase family DNA binding protein